MLTSWLLGAAAGLLWSGVAAADARGFEEFSLGLPADGQWRENAALYDIDGDGLLDLVAPTPRVETTPPRIWLFRPTGWELQTASFPPKPYYYGRVVVDKLDPADPYPTLFLAAHGQTVFVLKGEGLNRWVDAGSGLPERYPSKAMAYEDFNGDGCRDLLVAAETYQTRDRGIRMFHGDCLGRWTEASEGLPYGVYGSALAAGDWNWDGVPDLALCTNDRTASWLWLGNDGGGWIASGLPGVVCQDLGAYGNRLFLLEVEPDGEAQLYFYSRLNKLATGLKGPYTAFRVDDMDGNGLWDALLGRADGGVDLYLQQEDNTFVQSAFLPASLGTVKGIATGDIDGNGETDVVVNYAVPNGMGGIKVWLQFRRRGGSVTADHE
jgi:hypothetical protein